MNNKGLFAIIASCIIIATIFTVLYVQNISPEPEEKQIKLADDTNATAESVNSLVAALNDFSFNFYDTLKSSEDGNLFFSPYSIFTAFSMAYEGARGNTATEIENVLKILQNNSAQLGSFGRIYNLLNQNQEGYTISTANAFWKNIDYAFLPSYLSLLENFYMAEADELDFSKSAEAAQIINAWIEENTNGKIKDMVSADMFSEWTKLVLANAIYFKGLWAKPFDTEDTYDADFELSTGDTVIVDMMRSDSEDSEFNYTETDDLQILELPYTSDDIAMIVILPKENNISIAEAAINVENLTAWRNDFFEREVDVHLPKFKFETRYLLNDLMVEMGMVDAFSPGVADFSGMDGTDYLFISQAIHQAYVEVNEEGTEAAAATVIIMEATAAPAEPIEFNADHPFIFLIQHKLTDSILFMGRVTDPSV